MAACDNSIETVNTEEVGDHISKAGLKKNGTVYYFGFDIRHGPQEDARQYLPLMVYLENETGYRFQLKFTPKNSTLATMLGEKKVDFAALGATSFIKAKELYPVVSMVRGLNLQGKSEYQSFIVSHPDSNIKSIQQLVGRKIAFGSIDSTQGHLIPRIVLLEHNINLSDLSGYIYTGSHRNCAEAVLAKKADVCGMQDTLAKEMLNKKLLKLVHKSKFYPSSGIAAHSDVPENIRNKVRQALIRFKPQGIHKQNLYNWNKTEMPMGFEKAEEKDYLILQQKMKQLGLSE